MSSKESKDDGILRGRTRVPSGEVPVQGRPRHAKPGLRRFKRLYSQIGTTPVFSHIWKKDDPDVTGPTTREDHLFRHGWDMS